MLQVGAETLELKGSPGEELLHGEGLGREGGELVGVGGPLGLEGGDGVHVVEEEDGAGGGTEHGHLVTGGLPVLGGDDGAEDVGGQVPQLLVLLAEEDDDTVGLGVEGGGGVEGGLVDDLLDALLGDGELLVKGVDGAAGLGQLEEGVGVVLRGRHCD